MQLVRMTQFVPDSPEWDQVATAHVVTSLVLEVSFGGEELQGAPSVRKGHVECFSLFDPFAKTDKEGGGFQTRPQRGGKRKAGKMPALRHTLVVVVVGGDAMIEPG